MQDNKIIELLKKLSDEQITALLQYVDELDTPSNQWPSESSQEED